MVRKRLLKPYGLPFFMILLFLLFAWAVVQPAARAQGDRSQAENFLWTVQAPSNTVYLLGSIHLLTPESYPLAPQLEAAYEDAGRIVFETDIEGLQSPAYQDKLMRAGLYPEGRDIQQDLSRDTYEKLKVKVASAGLAMAPFARFRPWVCAQTLTLIEFQRRGFDPKYGIDTYFFGRAKQDGKDIFFLETVDEQLALFTGMDRQDQEAFLLQTLKDLEVIGRLAPDMLKAWRHGDAGRLAEIMRISFREHPHIYGRLVTQRNRKWVPKIEALMSQGENVLVVVGAGHLAGERSLPDLFREKGYPVAQR